MRASSNTEIIDGRIGKAMEKCPKCGCPSRRFRMSERMHNQLKEHA